MARSVLPRYDGDHELILDPTFFRSGRESRSFQAMQRAVVPKSLPSSDDAAIVSVRTHTLTWSGSSITNHLGNQHAGCSNTGAAFRAVLLQLDCLFDCRTCLGRDLTPCAQQVACPDAGLRPGTVVHVQHRPGYCHRESNVPVHSMCASAVQVKTTAPCVRAAAPKVVGRRQAFALVAGALPHPNASS